MSLQERIEASAWGRRVISGALVLLIALIVGDNLPGSEVRRQADEVGEPVLTALGAGQNWNVFARPYTSTVEVEVRFLHADGSRSTWRPPRGGPFLSPYRDYRWVKLVEYLDEPGLPIRLLTWAVNEEDDPRRPIARARLVRRERELARPGAPASARGPWRESVLVEIAAGS